METIKNSNRIYLVTEMEDGVNFSPPHLMSYGTLFQSYLTDDVLWELDLELLLRLSSSLIQDPELNGYDAINHLYYSNPTRCPDLVSACLFERWPVLSQSGTPPPPCFSSHLKSWKGTWWHWILEPGFSSSGEISCNSNNGRSGKNISE